MPTSQARLCSKAPLSCRFPLRLRRGVGPALGGGGGVLPRLALTSCPQRHPGRHPPTSCRLSNTRLHSKPAHGSELTVGVAAGVLPTGLWAPCSSSCSPCSFLCAPPCAPLHGPLRAPTVLLSVLLPVFLLVLSVLPHVLPPPHDRKCWAICIKTRLSERPEARAPWSPGNCRSPPGLLL